MRELESTLKEIGAKNGLEIALDENGACTLDLADGRVVTLPWFACRHGKTAETTP